MVDNKNLKFNIDLYADGADLKGILDLDKKKYVKGFTTNPSLMKKAGIKNYASFAKQILREIKNKPVSFEVFSDEIDEMEKQAREIASWGTNVFVKIPVTNSKGEKTSELINKLSSDGICCNITAVFTLEQTKEIIESISFETEAIISIFAGRIADAGVDPEPIIKEALNLSKNKPKIKILWASTREIFNIIQAEKLGCHIITVPNSILEKLKYFGKDLDSFSLETVNSFLKDSIEAGFTIKT